MRIKKIFFSISAVILAFSPVFSLNAYAASSVFNAQVATNVLIVRSGPGKNYATVKRLKSGTVVKVYEQKNGWYRVGIKEWSSGLYLKKTTKTVAVVKPSIKVAAKPEVEPEVKPVASVVPAAVSVSSANPSAACFTAIKNANAYCKSISSGCPSYSKTDKCVAANAKCEERQVAALDLCPKEN
ncbi:MAG: SH3 domain-containing protein [Patescibacteria group bacterium]|jgi:uncharacterized protein YgiM (DUF1202 family)